MPVKMEASVVTALYRNTQRLLLPPTYTVQNTHNCTDYTRQSIKISPPYLGRIDKFEAYKLKRTNLTFKVAISNI